CQQYDRLPPSF
nr:immunoglobulin light chain junction region [Macaca mulatta]MOX51557.1 immunoglobulin light chain junction region [Macaca mulatta]MOX51748.1 immunoglobulin light chain junction region [Macaca mulatta]MOX52311.1 immunoglobulin light chain junction region [Macaca mulatta]MOX53548.1 immunoglobulin light chain junction region [Macaca mulatta]